jgi:protein-S-isoprenylcysteine O-methyltransferase Ste14
VGLAFALFVRVTDAPPARRPLDLDATTPAHLRLVRRQHRLFYALLVAAPVEWLARGRPADWLQLAGAALFLAGVVGYRRAGWALGERLSPLVAPREPAALVDRGPYRRVRHPMYLAELAMALGAPLTLAAILSLVVTLAFTAVVLRRIAVEERVLAERVPGYRAYVRRTSRLVPHVY